MRTVVDFIGMILLVLACLWVAVVYVTPRQEKPLIACRPVVAATGWVRKAVVAMAPGSTVERVADVANGKVARACLTYMGNYFEVARKD